MYIAGTKILLSDNTERNIEEMAVGDSVLTYNETTKAIEPKEVTFVYIHPHGDLITFTFSNQTQITTSFDNSFYTEGFNLVSWLPSETNSIPGLGKEANQIRLHETTFFTKDENAFYVTAEELITPEINETLTYTINVADNNNFFVNSILAFNK
jgi:hypothetical protein